MPEADSRETRLWIFYSSKTEPEILVFYAEELSYLRDQSIEAKVVDIAESPEKARKHGIKATPQIMVEKGGKIQKKFKITIGLQEILQRKEIQEILE